MLGVLVASTACENYDIPQIVMFPGSSNLEDLETRKERLVSRISSVLEELLSGIVNLRNLINIEYTLRYSKSVPGRSNFLCSILAYIPPSLMLEGCRTRPRTSELRSFQKFPMSPSSYSGSCKRSRAKAMYTTLKAEKLPVDFTCTDHRVSVHVILFPRA